jgi:DNA recombination protein RmuC
MQLTTAFVLGLMLGGFIAFLAAMLYYGKRQQQAKSIATEVLDETSATTKAMLDETIVRISQEVQRIESRMGELQVAQSEKLGQLGENIRQVVTASEQISRETQKLDSALRNNKQMGSWGELQLRRLVELSGMNEYVDFDVQRGTAEGRPDMAIKFSNNSVVYVDAKISLNAYVEGVAAADAKARADFAKQQYQAIKEHVNALVKRNYHGDSNSLPFTVMYIQVEGSLAFADEGRSDIESIVEFALSRNIIVATPGTLMALLRTANFSWRQRQEVANALGLLDSIKELTKRLKVFMGHYDDIGTNLAKLNKSLGAMANSWNSRVVPQLEKINQLRPESIEVLAVQEPEIEITQARQIAD